MLYAPLCLALEPRKAIELCLSSAEAADAELETITTDLMDRIAATSNQFRFNRALHRNGHLDDIELTLRRQHGLSGA